MPMLETTVPLRQQLEETIRVIGSRTSFRPTLGLIVGSGLGGLVSSLRVEALTSPPNLIYDEGFFY